jgi:hypothetical protein
MCIDDVLYLPVTRRAPACHSSRAARRGAVHTRMDKVAEELEARDEAVTSRAPAETAHISREYRVHLAQAARNGHHGDGTDVISSAL